jgi:hypothetical protein
MFLRKDPLKRARLPDVTPGADVRTSDDASLGTVAEVGDISFKVDVPRGPDIWLGRDYVIDSTAEAVRMSFERSELPAYKLGQPGMEPEKDTSQESLSDAVISKEEQLEQRVRMEEELAEQRQQLPHTHPGGNEGAPPKTRGGTIGEPVESELRDYGIDPMRDQAPPEETPPSGEFSETGSYVDRHGAPSVRGTATSAADTMARGDGARGVEYSIPTQTEAHDPAKVRRRVTGGAMGAVAAVSLAGLGFLWLMQRRRNRKLDQRAKDAAAELADVAKDAVGRGIDSARDAARDVLAQARD